MSTLLLSTLPITNTLRNFDLLPCLPRLVSVTDASVIRTEGKKFGEGDRRTRETGVVLGKRGSSLLTAFPTLMSPWITTHRCTTVASLGEITCISAATVIVGDGRAALVIYLFRCLFAHLLRFRCLSTY